MLPEFEVETVLKTCVQEKVTAFGGVPTNMIDVMRSPLLSKYDISRIHAFINAGAPLPADVARQMLKMGIFPQGLAGTTEFCGSGGLRPTDPEDKVLYTVGRRLVGSDVATFGLGDPNKRLPFGEEGELGVKTLWFGYFREKEKSQEQLNKLGFFMTGDVCVIDEDGYLRYSGMRKEDMIIRGDQAIKPRDVEELLFTSPKIADAAIVGMPDPELGQRVCAYVVPKAGESITLDEVKSFLKGKVEEHKLPERLEIVGAIPRSAGAKVDKKTMRDDVAEKLKKEGKI
jgi:acyl-CoA synthetase (AMP-forming)/AMP-acid ligase II